MGKSESSKKYREEMKSQGYKSRSLWFDEKTIDVLDKISKKSLRKIGDLVSDAIIEYGNKHFDLEVKIDESLTTDELSKKMNSLASKMTRLAKVYFYSTLTEEDCVAIIDRLKTLRRKKKKIRTQEAYAALNSKTATKISSYLEYQSFVDTFKDEIYGDDE